MYTVRVKVRAAEVKEQQEKKGLEGRVTHRLQYILYYLSSRRWKYKTKQGVRKRLEKLEGLRPSAIFKWQDRYYGVCNSTEKIPLHEQSINIDKKIREMETKGESEWPVSDYFREAEGREWLSGFYIQVSKKGV